MHKKMIVLLITIALSASVLGIENVQAKGEDDHTSLVELLNRLDTSITSLRKGESGGASTLISEASTIYEDNFSSRVENIDSALHNKITQAFESLRLNPVEENIFILRADVSRAAGLIGVFLSPFYAYSMFIIFGIGVVVSLLVTMLNKRLVNWAQVREDKARISEFQKELREAHSRRDMKRLHKLQQHRDEILFLQKRVFSQTFKPTIIYFVPLILIWTALLSAYHGWVIAWLPFRIDLPIFGPLVAFGVGWWYFITYLGFSQIWRKILIGD